MNDDLISREWLEDAFDNLCCHNCKMCRNFRMEDSFYKCALIDNAPTVDERPKVDVLNKIPKDFVYDTETSEFYCYRNKYTGEEIHIIKSPKTYILADEIGQRPAEWCDDKCSVCGKGIENLISSPEWYRNEEPNFCPFCGARVRRGDV